MTRKAILRGLIALAAIGECRCSQSTGDVETDRPTSVDATQSETWNALRSSHGTYSVKYRFNPTPAPLNEPFGIEAVVMRSDGRDFDATVTALAVDARMPHHRHGMNTVPVIEHLGNGRYRIEGMQFHMPGRWELYFDLTERGLTERAQDVIELE